MYFIVLNYQIYRFTLPSPFLAVCWVISCYMPFWQKRYGFTPQRLLTVCYVIIEKRYCFTPHLPFTVCYVIIGKRYGFTHHLPSTVWYVIIEERYGFTHHFPSTVCYVIIEKRYGFTPHFPFTVAFVISSLCVCPVCCKRWDKLAYIWYLRVMG